MTSEPLILAIDEGTTSTRAIAFSQAGEIVAQASRPIQSYYPQAAWVEQDAAEIWDQTHACVAEVLATVGTGNVCAIGVTNQRETVVFFDRRTGVPLAPAIVWQDRRTADACRRLRDDGLEPVIQRTTGLLADPYFSATKIAWALEHWPSVAAAADAGHLGVGTIDAYLMHRLTEGASFVTDATNAARTMLMRLSDCAWDEGLCARFNVSPDWLPRIVDCTGYLGETRLFGRSLPITGMAGDQQAAAIGQGCLTAGQVKATYGTGAFMIAHAGAVPPFSQNRLLTTVAWRLNGQTAYALEGSIFVAGSAIQWLRDGLGLIADAADSAVMAASVPDTAGVQFVPAFSGLGAPYWRAEARGLITGLTAGTTRAHIVRACLEAMSQQTADLFDALAADGVTPQAVRVDGGMVANDWLCQNLADVLGIAVERPRVLDTTALGAAMLAGLGAGLFPDLASTARMWQAERRFAPAMQPSARDALRQAWARAIAMTLSGVH